VAVLTVAISGGNVAGEAILSMSKRTGFGVHSPFDGARFSRFALWRRGAGDYVRDSNVPSLRQKREDHARRRANLTGDHRLDLISRSAQIFCALSRLVPVTE
jgi:hypothetical protein